MGAYKICVECGKKFDPVFQGDEDDVRCIDCIDREMAKDGVADKVLGELE